MTDDAIRALQARAKAEGFTRRFTDAEEKAFMDDLSGEPEMDPGPFRVECPLCGTVAESWHRDFPAPKGATIGVAYCECGNIGADSMGFRDYGRVLQRAPSEQIEVRDSLTALTPGQIDQAQTWWASLPEAERKSRREHSAKLRRNFGIALPVDEDGWAAVCYEDENA